MVRHVRFGLAEQEGSDVNPEQNDNFMLVRYMPSGKFLLTLSQDKGDVKLWDATELRFGIPTPDMEFVGRWAILLGSESMCAIGAGSRSSSAEELCVLEGRKDVRK